MAYQALVPLHQLYDGYRRVFRVAGQDFLLLQEAGRVNLLVNRCPHMQAPLDRATIDRGALRCPVHGIEFDLRSGQALNAPGGCVGPLEFVPLVYQGNSLGVEL